MCVINHGIVTVVICTLERLTNDLTNNSDTERSRLSGNGCHCRRLVCDRWDEAKRLFGALRTHPVKISLKIVTRRDGL